MDFHKLILCKKTLNGNHYFHISNTENNKLIIFLHGGVSNPYFKRNSSVDLDYLIENNPHLINQASIHNFDVILPITNDSLNWLDRNSYCFDEFKSYINSLKKKYSEIWISGFSDGGTGCYQMFYDNPQYFNGLIVFNGYPQRNNYYKKVDYSSVTNKKVLFVSTKKDKRIPYEFLLTEYCKQKTHNPNTYIFCQVLKKAHIHSAVIIKQILI